MLGEYEMKPKNVVVLMGGISPEREISLRSGNAVARALKEAEFNVTCIDVKDEKIEELDRMDIDVAFIALHGYFGEDGGVQQLLESKGIPYTGSGINASRLAMDKLATKKCFIEAGIRTPDYITVTEFQELQEMQREISKLGLPVVLKPTRNGSSIGISIIKNINDLQIGLEKAFGFGYELLIEIKPAVEFYNYEAKYKDDRTKYLIVEKNLSERRNTVGDSSRTIGFLLPATYSNAQELAVNAHKVLGCKGFSRVDMLLDDRDNLYLLEINTIPGCTQTDRLPRPLRRAGGLRNA